MKNALNKHTICLSAMAILLSFCSVAQTASTPSSVNITSKEPAVNEEEAEPIGYLQCKILKSGWINHEWHAGHKICQYNLQDTTVKTQGGGWAAGHWICKKYQIIEGLGGQCTQWDWTKGKWTKTYEEIDVVK